MGYIPNDESITVDFLSTFREIEDETLSKSSIAAQ